jgi:lipopolysaccharide/colanic/teichoic acid biosynthesis glycosyltransferase
VANPTWTATREAPLLDAHCPPSTGKRALDLCIGLPLALISLPVVAVAALVSLAALRTNPFFVHDRVGHGGSTFRVVKVRTLPRTTGAYVDKFAIDADRVPRATQLLRQLHLDELPQLWLVVAGSMSLVGPRPEMRNLHDDMDPTFAELRCKVRPGLTGLWQISPHCVGLIGQRPEYDRIYIEMRSWRMDLWIAARTVLKILGRGTVHLYEVPEWAFPKQPARVASVSASTQGSAQAA